MRAVKSPYFVLKTEFTVNEELEFEGFIDYITREGVKGSDMKVKSMNPHYQFENSKLDIQQEQYLKYIDYMSRKTALEKKRKLSVDELQSLNLLKKYENDDMVQMLQGMKQSKFQTNLKEELQTGAFDFYSDDLSPADIRTYKRKFQEAQKNGSVMYRDVMSFSTEALIVAGIYNPFTDELNRKELIVASRKMLREMYKRENLQTTGLTVCEIHYNTKHFHIHFATVETQNKRALVEFEGKVQAQGLRKKSTLQAMKSVFANQIFERTDKLVEISGLRDNMRHEVKDEFQHTDSNRALTLISKLKRLLPPDKRKWNSKNLSDPARKIMQELIDELMSSNSNFNRYKRLATEENEHREKMFGQLSDSRSSFYDGRMHGAPDGVYYRLGNSILEELRNNSTKDKSNEALARVSKDYKQKVNLDRAINTGHYQLKKLERTVDNSFEQYRIEQERHKLERDIERAKWEQSL